MAKGIVLRFFDAEPGADDNNVVLKAEVLFVGAAVPNGPRTDMGGDGGGVQVPWNIAGTAAQFSNNVESAVVARAAVLGFTLANTDVLFPAFTRGS